MLPGCSPGTRIDIFVITHPIFTDISNNNVLASDMYDTIVGQPDRIKNIEPATPDHYDAICREIFTEVCGGP